MKCINCGCESVEQTCIPCELEIQAREKPPYLLDMEAIAKNQRPVGEFQMAMATLLQKRPQDFLSRLSALQQAYTERCKALQAVVEARGPAGRVQSQEGPLADDGSERVEELIERLLREAAS